MFCTNCGNPNEDSHKFCSDCGHTLSKVLDDKEVINEGNTTNETALHNENVETESTSIEISEEASEQPIEDVSIEEETVPDETNHKSLKKKNVLIPILALLALLIGGAGAFSYFASNNDRSNTSAINENVEPLERESEQEKELDLTITAIDTINYPEIILQISADEKLVEKLLNAQNQIVLTEKEQVQEIKMVKAAGEGKLELVYETNNFNSDKASEVRKVELKYDKYVQSETYQSYAQKDLAVEHFSCNTDNYPTVNCFFSVYDDRQNRLENLSFQPEMINLTEDDQSVKDIKFGKVDNSNVYTSTNIVMDLSVSMNHNNRIGSIKSGVQAFLDGVTVENHNLIGLLTFADREYINQYEFTSDKNSIRDNVVNMSTYGNCTALYEAINTAIFNTSYNNVGGSKYVIVYTDGQENCSDYVSADTLIQNALQLGVTIYAVSEDDYSELANIAESTNGSYTKIGDDYNLLQDLYKEIYENKRTQYVLTYTSENPKKQPRELEFSMKNHHYNTNHTKNTVTPKLIDNFEVADVMQQYQIAWSIALSNQDVYAVEPFVTTHHPETNDNSVFNIVYDQIFGYLNSSGERSGGTIHVDKYAGEYLQYETPDYELVDAEKVSEKHYKMRIVKQTEREAYLLVNRNDYSKGFHSPLTTYRETAYTYNVVNQNGLWLVDSIEDSAVPVCYTDNSYSTKYARQDGKTTKSNGNCPGLGKSER